MGLIAQKLRRESAHFYLPDGTPLYEVPRADGKGVRPPTLKDARAVGAYPSVTTIESILSKEPLVNWRIEQGILAAKNTPQDRYESDEEWAERVSEIAQLATEVAAGLGSKWHDAAAKWLSGDGEDWPTELMASSRAFCRWWLENGFYVDALERTVTHPLGFGGRIDCVTREGK